MRPLLLRSPASEPGGCILLHCEGVIMPAMPVPQTRRAQLGAARSRDRERRAPARHVSRTRTEVR
jgi:hypothetical protein